MQTQEERILELLLKKDYDTLYQENQKFIYHMVQKFKNITPDFEELVSCANLGFAKSIHHYDVHNESGTKFITYAACIIQNELLMLNRKLTNASSIKNTISYEEAVYHNSKNGEDIRLIDMLASDENLEEDYIMRSASQELYKNLSCLNPKERLVIEGRLNEKTQRDIALINNLSQSYVSRLEQQAIRKLRKYMLAIKKPKKSNVVHKNKIHKKEVMQMNTTTPQIKDVTPIQSKAVSEKAVAPAMVVTKPKRLMPVRTIFETDYFVYEIHQNRNVYAMSKNKDIEMLTLNKDTLHNLILDLQELQQALAL